MDCVFVPLPLRRRVLRCCTSKVFAPSVAFARATRARHPLVPLRGWLSTRQDSSSYGPNTCSPPMATSSWRFGSRVSPSTGHQLRGCLATTPAGLSPASPSQLPGHTLLRQPHRCSLAEPRTRPRAAQPRPSASAGALHSHGPVDPLPEQVRVAAVARVLLDHVDHDPGSENSLPSRVPVTSSDGAAGTTARARAPRQAASGSGLIRLRAALGAGSACPAEPRAIVARGTPP